MTRARDKTPKAAPKPADQVRQKPITDQPTSSGRSNYFGLAKFSER